MHWTMFAAAVGLSASVAVFAAEAATDGPSDPQIAHIAYTAGQLDVSAAKLALAKSKNPAVREFAGTMVRDHEAVNVKALSAGEEARRYARGQSGQRVAEQQVSTAITRLKSLDGAAFDRAYAEQEAGYHKAVNAALKDTLIPSADNAELKSLLETGLSLFREHQRHAEHLAADLN